MRFRKKPVEIEALRVPAPIDYYHESEYLDAVNVVASWCYGVVVLAGGPFDLADPHRARAIQISTLEGVMTASPGDWVIRGVQGEHYPCKPDIFAATYDPVSESSLSDGGGS